MLQSLLLTISTGFVVHNETSSGNKWGVSPELLNSEFTLSPKNPFRTDGISLNLPNTYGICFGSVLCSKMSTVTFFRILASSWHLSIGSREIPSPNLCLNLPDHPPRLPLHHSNRCCLWHRRPAVEVPSSLLSSVLRTAAAATPALNRKSTKLNTTLLIQSPHVSYRAEKGKAKVRWCQFLSLWFHDLHLQFLKYC